MGMLTVPILQGTRELGAVHVYDEGLYLRFEAKTFRCYEGIYRAYLQFDRGECLLGVLEPAARGMCCVRCFAKQQLCPFGSLRSAILRSREETCWQEYDGRLPGEFSARIPKRGTLQRKEGDTTLIALPYAADRPFPLSELFCLSSVGRIREQSYVIYRFAENGRPKI